MIKNKIMKKYNVSYTVYFESNIKNVDTVVMANNESEAEKTADTKLDKYLSKREIDSYELNSVDLYDSTFHSADLNKFVEYKPA